MDNEQVTISKKKYTAATRIGILAVVAVIGLGVGLITSLSEIRQLRAENKVYSTELAELQDKATEIENTLTELSEAKDGLYDKLEELDSPTSLTSENDEIVQPASVKVAAANAQDEIKLLTDKLAQLQIGTESAVIAYDTVSQVVVETLEYMESIPEGIPMAGTLTDYYGYRKDPLVGSQKLHTGLDIGAKAGTPIYATAGGTVIVSKYHRTYGNMIEIDHGNGYTTVFAHCSSRLVAVGDTVEKGQKIALCGRTGRVTGPHLHYEVKLNGQFVDPLNFMEWE